MRSLGWMLTQFDWCPYRKGQFGHTPKECHVNMKMAIYKPGREAWNGPFPDGLQKEPALPILPSQTSDSRTLRQQMSVVYINRSVSSAVAAPGH